MKFLQSLSRRRFVFYEEVVFTGLNDEKTHFSLSTPWCVLSIEVPPSLRNRVLQIEEYFADRKTKKVATAQLGWLFPHISHYPFAYYLPRGLFSLATSLPWTEKSSARLVSHLHSPKGLIQVLFDRERSRNIGPYLPDKWSWNERAILDGSRVSKSKYFDPIATQSWVKHSQLLDRTQSENGRRLLERLTVLQQQNETKFIQAMRTLVRQNHYVTSHCHSAVSPALRHRTHARSALKEFLEDEKGHDILMAKSLQALGISDPNHLPPLNSFSMLVDLLTHCAENHFVSFCFVLDAFESTSYSSQDTWAQLLSQSETTKRAALGLQAHRDINLRNHHDSVAQTFLEGLPHIDYHTALLAIRMAELTSILMEIGYVELIKETSIPGASAYHASR